MKFSHLLFAIVGTTLATLSSCKKEQVNADFSASKVSGTVPLFVSFSNLSTGAISYKWDFGDGSTSNDENPNHTYQSSGTFIVTLTAFSKNENDKKTQSINVIAQAKPLVDFNYSPSSGYAPCKITFTNKTTGATTYNWDFGNGQSSTSTNPSVIYSTGGTYNITLTATGPGGTEKLSKSISIQNPPTKFKLNSIKLTNFPTTRSDGSGWDVGSAPDLRIKITDDQNSNFFESPTYFQDVVKSKLPITFSDGFPLTFSNFDYKYIFLLMDYDDFLPDEQMGGYYFTIKDYIPKNGDPYPSSITLSNANSEITFVFNVEWLP